MNTNLNKLLFHIYNLMYEVEYKNVFFHMRNAVSINFRPFAPPTEPAHKENIVSLLGRHWLMQSFTSIHWHKQTSSSNQSYKYNTPGVNFINVLRAHIFCTKGFSAAFSSYVWAKKALSYKKRTCRWAQGSISPTHWRKAQRYWHNQFHQQNYTQLYQ